MISDFRFMFHSDGRRECCVSKLFNSGSSKCCNRSIISIDAECEIWKKTSKNESFVSSKKILFRSSELKKYLYNLAFKIHVTRITKDFFIRLCSIFCIFRNEKIFRNLALYSKNAHEKLCFQNSYYYDL